MLTAWPYRAVVALMRALAVPTPLAGSDEAAANPLSTPLFLTFYATRRQAAADRSRDHGADIGTNSRHFCL
jgi:hypothetical protein